MPTFNYTVDTQPMADEMRSVSHHVNGTTGAVVAMQAAVIAAEKDGADHVCSNVNKGFYSLIRSQISQKLAKFKSDVDSHLIQLVQQKKALTSIQTRMERDYNMISGRYIKLFNELNANLKNRIFELDKPTVDFAYKEIDKVTNRTRYLTATIPISQLESISLSQQIVASNVKQRALNTINSMRSFLREMNVQKDVTDQILINDINITKVGMSYIPIAILEFNLDKTDTRNIDIAITNTELNGIAKAAIKNAVYNQIASLKWEQKPMPMPEIASEFSKLLSVSSKSKRIKDLALHLYLENKYQTL